MPARTGPSLKLLLACAVPIVVALALLPRVIDLYQTELLIYGLTLPSPRSASICCSATRACCRSAIPPISVPAPMRWRSSSAISACIPWSCASWAASPPRS